MVGEPSTSVIVRAPVAVVAEASSVTEPVLVPAQTDASSAPVMVRVTVIVVPPSLLVTTNVSDRDALAARAFTVESLSSSV